MLIRAHHFSCLPYPVRIGCNASVSNRMNRKNASIRGVSRWSGCARIRHARVSAAKRAKDTHQIRLGIAQSRHPPGLAILPNRLTPSRPPKAG